MNDVFVDNAQYIYTAIYMYNFIEYRYSYSGTSGSFWQFKRNELHNNINVNLNNSSSFKYKVNFIDNVVGDGTAKGVKITVPLEYLSNFSRSLEMSLINYKVELELNRGRKMYFIERHY